MPYRLLSEFESVFRGHPYRHRDSSIGDRVAIQLYEDLVALGRSAKLTEHVNTNDWVVNRRNRRQGVAARRGDGTFGEIVPGEVAVVEPDYRVARGIVATVEVGVEMKILAKAMIKQVDRVIGDLQKQVTHFRKGAGNPICVAFVGVNHAAYAVSFEGDRQFRTDGKAHRHPTQEAAEAERRIVAMVAPVYDELVILSYAATNDAPYPFMWMNAVETEQDYGAALVRISREYDRRF